MILKTKFLGVMRKKFLFLKWKAFFTEGTDLQGTRFTRKISEFCSSHFFDLCISWYSSQGEVHLDSGKDKGEVWCNFRHQTGQNNYCQQTNLLTQAAVFSNVVSQLLVSLYMDLMYYYPLPPSSTLAPFHPHKEVADIQDLDCPDTRDLQIL